MGEQQAVTKPLPGWVYRAILYARMSGLQALALSNYCDRHSFRDWTPVTDAAGLFGFLMMVLNPFCAIGLLFKRHSNLEQAAILGGLLLAILIADVIAFLPLIQ